jgi:hypothetical protein
VRASLKHVRMIHSDKAGGPQEGSPIDWAALVAHTIHPAKVAILEALRSVGVALSATELTEMLSDGEFNFDIVHYHLLSLAKVGAVAQTSSRPVRGARERHYVLSGLDL